MDKDFNKERDSRQRFLDRQRAELELLHDADALKERIKALVKKQEEFSNLPAPSGKEEIEQRFKDKTFVLLQLEEYRRALSNLEDPDGQELELSLDI